LRLQAIFHNRALGVINGETTTQAALRNGDIAQLGGAKIQFWLSPPVQASLGAREAATWILAGLVALLEVLAVYVLIR